MSEIVPLTEESDNIANGDYVPEGDLAAPTYIGLFSKFLRTLKSLVVLAKCLDE